MIDITVCVLAVGYYPSGLYKMYCSLQLSTVPVIVLLGKHYLYVTVNLHAALLADVLCYSDQVMPIFGINLNIIRA